MTNILSVLEEKGQRLLAYQPYPASLSKNLQEWFKIELTYTSNAIEGNTLSRAETALVVEKGLTVEGKTIQEHQEAVNHAETITWLIQEICTHKNLTITETLILDIHERILQKIDTQNAGRYRTIPVRIAGSTVVLPNPLKVPHLMNQFTTWLNDPHDSPLSLAADAHYQLVSIHPFVDGNGRTARLLMNLILMKSGYPPAIIRKEDRRLYLKSLEKAQLGGSLADYYALIYKAIDRSLDIYLDTLEGKEKEKLLTKQPLLKIGELAKLVNETVPTIRHWTKSGLLNVTKYSPGGYQLYHQNSVAQAIKIRQLQTTKRLTLAEIKKKIFTP
jgi:Fic family protein